MFTQGGERIRRYLSFRLKNDGVFKAYWRVTCVSLQRKSRKINYF